MFDWNLAQFDAGINNVTGLRRTAEVFVVVQCDQIVQGSE